MKYWQPTDTRTFHSFKRRPSGFCRTLCTLAARGERPYLLGASSNETHNAELNIKLWSLSELHYLFTCSVLLSTSGRALEARLWSGGRRYTRLVYTSQQSDTAVVKKERKEKKNQIRWESALYKNSSCAAFLPWDDKMDSPSSCTLGRSDRCW